MSVLYSNAAACLFELQLYNSCIMLSDIAIMVDPVYNKGYYRKLRSLFEIKSFELVPSLFLTISNFISKNDLEQLNTRYTHLYSQSCGVFNWRGLLDGSVPQGEFSS